MFDQNIENIAFLNLFTCDTFVSITVVNVEEQFVVDVLIKSLRFREWVSKDLLECVKIVTLQ